MRNFSCRVMGALYPGLVRGGRGVQSTGARHVLRGPSRGPALIKFFLRTHAKKCWRNYVFAMLKPMSSGRSGGDKSLPSKNSRPPNKERKFVLGGRQNPSLPSDKYRKKLNVFYTCCLWVRTAAIGLLSSIYCSHYGFLRKLIKNKLFSALVQNKTIYFSSTLQHVSSFLQALVKALRIC